MTETELAAILEFEMKQRGSMQPSFPTIVAEGPNAAIPHAVPGRRRVKQSSLLLFDWGAVSEHYCSDLTRVLVMGRIPPRLKQVYQIVLEAQQKAIKAVGPGMRVCDIDQVARAKKGHFLTRRELVDLILSEAGYEGRAILGRGLLDPAAGSGSFLVQAARRLRRAIFESEGIIDDREAAPAKRLRAAKAYLTYLQRDLAGMEINPFSCYLAELNLYIQALDDVIYVYHHDKAPQSCEMPYRLLLPKKIDGLLLAGRSGLVYGPNFRQRYSVMLHGQAAGIAAALSAADGVVPRKLDVRRLQKTLIRVGCPLGDEKRIKELGLK